MAPLGGVARPRLPPIPPLLLPPIPPSPDGGGRRNKSDFSLPPSLPPRLSTEHRRGAFLLIRNSPIWKSNWGNYTVCWNNLFPISKKKNDCFFKKNSNLAPSSPSPPSFSGPLVTPPSFSPFPSVFADGGGGGGERGERQKGLGERGRKKSCWRNTRTLNLETRLLCTSREKRKGKRVLSVATPLSLQIVVRPVVVQKKT